jgi:hypothetical protein
MFYAAAKPQRQLRAAVKLLIKLLNSKMKKTIFFSAICMLLAAACKKDKTETPSGPPPSLIIVKQTISSGTPVNLYEEYIYDSDKRLAEIKQPQVNNSNISRKYFYTGSQVKFRYYNNGAEQNAGAFNYLLNGAGQIQESEQVGANSRINWEYDAAGYIKKGNYFRNGVSEGYTVYSYSGSNVLDSITFYEPNGKQAYVSIFLYESGKANTIGNENRGLAIFGKDQRQPLKKETRIVYNYPGYAGQRLKFFDFAYDYTYDGSGRVKSSVITRTDYAPNGNSGFYTLAAYEYIYQ